MAANRGQQGALVGNRLALVGAVLYFMEWVGIAVAPQLPTDKLGGGPAAIVSAYGHHPGRTASLAGWLSLVLLGRIAFCAGLRDALRAAPRTAALADWALAAMVVSVVIEVVDYGFVATGAWLAHAHAAPGPIVALDAAGTFVFNLIAAPLGVSVFGCSLAMLLSRLFPRWLAWLGLAAGSLAACGGIASAASAGTSGGLHDLASVLMEIPLLGFWVWILVTGAILYRAAPSRREPEQKPEARLEPTAA